MSSIDTFIDVICNEDWTYFASSGIDNNGDFSYSTGITIKCKSEQVIVNIVKDDKIVSEAKTKLYTKSKVAAGGFLVNGANKTFTNSPLELAGCYKISQVAEHKDKNGSIKYYEIWL
jgi:hypothetical protein